MNLWPKASAFALAALLLAPPAVHAQTAQPSVVTIDAIISMTGPAANLGGDEAAGLAAYEKFVNRTGGIHGKPVKFHLLDDQSQPAVAVQLLNSLVPAKPAVVLGSSLAGPTQAMAALIKDGPVLYGLTPNFVPPPHGYVFTTSAPTQDLNAAGVAFYRARGLTKIAIIVTTDSSGQNNLQSVLDSLKRPENTSMKVVDTEQFANGDVSIAAQVAKIKASGAQVIFALPNGAAFGTTLQALSNAGVDLPVYTSAANFSPVLLDRFKSVLPRELVATGASWFNRDRPARDPLKAPIDDFYTALAADGIANPTASHAFAWDPASIVVTALRSLPPSPSAMQLRDAIEKMHRFPGVQGMYDFTTGDQRGASLNGVLVIRNDPDHPGRVAVVSKPGGLPL